MQQWQATRPRCLGVTDTTVEPTLLLNYGEYDSFEDAPPVTGSCMYTSISRGAVAPPSCQHQNYYDTLAAPTASYVRSPSAIHLKYPAQTATVSSTFTDALLAEDQRESEVLQSPDAAPYHTSPLMDDTRHVEHSGRKLFYSHPLNTYIEIYT